MPIALVAVDAVVVGNYDSNNNSDNNNRTTTAASIATARLSICVTKMSAKQYLFSLKSTCFFWQLILFAIYAVVVAVAAAVAVVAVVAVVSAV